MIDVYEDKFKVFNVLFKNIFKLNYLKYIIIFIDDKYQ